MELGAVFARFEGLGNNSEFGIVLAKAASTVPVGLFRTVGFNHTEQMINAVEAGFDGMFASGNYRFVRPDGWTDHALDCLRYGFRFRTGIPATEPDPARLERQMDSFR